MATAKKRTPMVDHVRPYLEGVAKNLVDKLYGPHGPAWGTPLTEIEDTLLAVRQILTQSMLGQALTRQADAHPDSPPVYRTCPGCQQPLTCPDTQQRLVTTRAGEAAWAEPEAYCNRCRRAFFPSVQEPGHRPV